MKQFILLLACLAVPSYAWADCAQRTVFDEEDISSGAVTSSAIDVRGATQIELQTNLTDASDGVSDITYAFTSSATSTGTFNKVGFGCNYSYPALTCKQGTMNFDPQDAAQGKAFNMFFPYQAKYLKITGTPTGHGAGDELNLVLFICGPKVKQ